MKYCNKNYQVGEFCKLLQAEDTLHVREILDFFTSRYPVEDMEEHYHCSEDNCGIRVFDRFFSYFRIYRDVEEVQKKINSPKFSVHSLEKLVTYLISRRNPAKETLEDVLTKYLYFLDPDRIVGLISDTDLITSQPLFTLHCLGLLDNHHIDALLARSDKIHARLTGLFLDAPEENIAMILSVNPVIYDYIILFLELDGKIEDSIRFQNNYAEIIESANRIKGLIHRIQGLDLSADPVNRGARIEAIVNGMKEFSDSEYTFSVLVRNQIFMDEQEKQVVRRLSIESGVLDFFNTRRDRA